MQKVFDEVGTLDKKCYELFDLTEDILMEHASTSMLNFIEKKFKSNSKIFIISGAGNNGADGIALARLLQGKYKVSLYIPFGAKSPMAKLQLERAKLVKVKIVDDIKKCDVVVDCLFGSGLNRDLDKNSIDIIKKLNKLKAYKIACDIPSGINNLGQANNTAFISDTTITMGALKKSLFTDIAKDYMGDIIVANLGVQRKIYEDKTNCFLLEQKDLKLPKRKRSNTNKGTFGHLSVIVGQKQGAGLICAQSAFAFGAGLVTAITKNKDIPNNIMSSKYLPKNTTAIAIGMGLGAIYDKSLLDNKIAKIIDADIFYDKNILKLLTQDNIVITPHPKEFCSLLKLCDIVDIDIKTLQQNRFYYVEMFCKKYKKPVLLLKGANVLIGQNKKTFINNLGSSVLSFGGSGDILGGLIGSLLAQGYNPLESAINGSLAHTIASNNYSKNNYAMTPDDLIEEIKNL